MSDGGKDNVVDARARFAEAGAQRLRRVRGPGLLEHPGANSIRSMPRSKICSTRSWTGPRSTRRQAGPTRRSAFALRWRK